MSTSYFASDLKFEVGKWPKIVTVNCQKWLFIRLNKDVDGDTVSATYKSWNNNSTITIWND